jgi:hypothetical protein
MLRKGISNKTNKVTAPRLTISEGVAKYAAFGVTDVLLTRRANKVCSALDGCVEYKDGMWQVVGSRVLEGIEEERTLRWGRVFITKPVMTFADADLAAFATALARFNENFEMASFMVAKRLCKATGRGITIQALDRWSEYCPPLRRGLERTSVIDPISNRGFVWVYDAQDEAELTKALKAESKARTTQPDFTKPVTLGVAAKAAGLTTLSQRLYLN